VRSRLRFASEPANGTAACCRPSIIPIVERHALAHFASSTGIVWRIGGRYHTRPLGAKLQVESAWAMGSSFGLVIRAMVMLACLAVVPLVAMYGKYAPDFAQAVMEAYKSRTRANADTDPREAGGDAPPFSGSAARNGGVPSKYTGSPLPYGAPLTSIDRGLNASPLSDSAPAGPAADDDEGLKRASFNAPLSDRAGERGGSPRPNSASPGNTTTFSSNGPDQIHPAAGAIAPRSGDSTTATGDDCTTQFRRMEQRLRELGATYYLLETWGSSGDRYRFFCKMAIAGTADYNRNRIFQATAGDPLHAMQDVLEQVEQWRAGRQP
jgi:hypothetical protein